jgi:outer membrane protein TolC
MRRSLFPGLLLGCAVLCFGVFWDAPFARAQSDAELESEEPMSVPRTQAALPGDLQPGAEIVTDGRSLSISEAVALSIRNNLNVEVERYEPLIAEADSEGAWGAYDPTISANMGYEVEKTPAVSALQGVGGTGQSRDRFQGGGVGVDQLIPYIGASLNFRFDGASNRTRSSFPNRNPRYDSSFFMSARVPLARNLIWNEAWTNVKVQEISYRRSNETFRTALMDTVRGTVDSYWNLVAARDQVGVAQKSLETARALLDQTEIQYEVGVVSRVEVVEAEAGVADREFNLIRTANVFRNAQDQVIAAVLGSEFAASTSFQFVPTEDPESYESKRVDVERSVREAFIRRPELQVEDRNIEQGKIDLKFAKNQRLPQIDLEMRYGFVGLGGDGVGPPPVPGDESFSDSTDDFFTSDGADNYRVQGTFSIPIPNTTARKRVARSQLQLRRSKTRRLRLEQDIILEVRAAARLLLASAQGIGASERRRLAAKEQLRAERIRLEHGESTPFEVLQRETDFVDAESQKIAALQAYRSAEIGLERAKGTILDFHHIVVDDARKIEN